MTTVNADETRDVEEAVASWAGAYLKEVRG